MNHNYHKLLIYFCPNKPYWRLIEHNEWKVQSSVGPFYGIHFKDRLFDNHYDLFDDQGLPIRGSKSEPIYNYTTICSYALANFERYLESGEMQFTEPLLIALEFLKRENVRTKYEGIVFPYQGKLSAMNQGEALAVIARAYEIRPDPTLRIFAQGVIKAYLYAIEDDGVKGCFTGLNGVYWYEELAENPAKHILNGMLYALIGLYDIIQVFPDVDDAQMLWSKGLQYVKRALPLFDSGRWSWYWVDEVAPNYIASMMYHNLHICQLRHLGQITDINEFMEYATIFEMYQKSISNRMYAGYELYKGKKRIK